MARLEPPGTGRNSETGWEGRGGLTVSPQYQGTSPSMVDGSTPLICSEIRIDQDDFIFFIISILLKYFNE